VCKIRGVSFNQQQPMGLSALGLRLYAGAACMLLFCAFTLSAQQVPTFPQVVPNQTQTSPRPIEKNAPVPQGPKVEAGAAVDSNGYRVGPADVLKIEVWNEEKFSGPLTVHQDGKITLPLLGDLQAGGMTPVEIEQEVAKALSKYVVKPLVTVTVLDVESKKYYMDGEVNHPGEYALAVPTTILEAISKAGGLQEFASEKKIYVLRGTKRIPFNYKEVLRGRHMEQNVPLEPGDHIVVP
jgi:polysaccharide biosynthesis/export protein